MFSNSSLLVESVEGTQQVSNNPSCKVVQFSEYTPLVARLKSVVEHEIYVQSEISAGASLQSSN
jgi:hypothetical protein